MTNPLVYFDDEHDLNVEWSLDDARFGIYISRKNPDDCGWFYVDGKKMRGGKLPNELLQLIENYNDNNSEGMYKKLVRITKDPFGRDEETWWCETDDGEIVYVWRQLLDLDVQTRLLSQFKGNDLETAINEDGE